MSEYNADLADKLDVDQEQIEKFAEFMKYLDGGDWAMDPRVENELENVLSEEGVIGMYSGKESGEERIPLIEKFSPNESEWGGKTIFEASQPRNVTLADNLPLAFPVLKPTENFIHEFIEDYEIRLTSVEGVSRDQLMRIFMAMFGSNPGEDGSAPNALEIALSAGPEDKD